MSRKSNKGARAKQASAEASNPAQGMFSKIGAGWLAFGVCVFLAAITWVIFGRTVWGNYSFVPYDDNQYVYNNPEVTRGLSWKTLGWAFNPAHSDLHLWTPLARISHMIDCQVYGLQPCGHHLTNVLLHIATVIVLFLVLRQMTGALWRSAFVAAVFAIHPLRAESVAWVSERKDVLSGLFFMLALGVYVYYVRKRSVVRYAAVMLLFALGIMAKQMIVTLPCVLLLLDYWPLRRFAKQTGDGRGGLQVFLRLVIEKIPLFMLTAASCIQSFPERKPEPGLVVTGLSQTSWLRIGNALVSYIIYIGKLFYPVKLSVYYPYPAEIPAWQALGAFALLAGVSIAVFAWRGRHPEFLTGWFWYLGMLTPVIGFIPLGKEGHADRYTYLPEIGLCIMVAWGAASLAAGLPRRREILGMASALALAVLARLAAEQTAYWQNGVTLWKHALACTPDDGYIRNFLGYALQFENQDLDGAAVEFRKAIALAPDYAEPENNLGLVLLEQKDVDGAITHFQRALQIDAGHVEARSNVAIALIEKNRIDEAIAQLQMLVRYTPNRPDVRINLGYALQQKGDLDGAIAQFRKALDIKPDYADAHASLGGALLAKGEAREAVAEYEKALRADPQNARVELTLARILATSPDASARDGAKAVTLASQLDEADRNDPIVLDTLAAAYAEAERWPDAIETARRALELATAAGDTKLANELQARLALYRANTPLRLPPAKTPGH